MIDPKLKQRLAKVYELVKRGTEGEKDAARKALDKMLAKYNLEGIDLNGIAKSKYKFKYSAEMDVMLIERLVKSLLTDKDCLTDGYRFIGGVKEIVLQLTYLDYITLTASYEYFRRHMKAQWKVFCIPNLKRCRTAASRNKRREELRAKFFSIYCQQSNLYQPHELRPLIWKDLTAQQKKDYIKLQEVEGGKYNRQVTNGLLLEN